MNKIKSYKTNKAILHTNYNQTEVDDRFWLNNSPNSIIASGPPNGDAPLGKLSYTNPKKSIEKALKKAMELSGLKVEEIEVAKYLKKYLF